MAVYGTEKKSITELTWLEFQQLRKLTLAEVREFCVSRGVGGRDIDVYRMLADRDMLPDIRAELVLSCVEQAVKDGTADFKHPNYELGKLRQDDIIAGYKRYPKALKKLGADIPSIVAVALGKDKKLREIAIEYNISQSRISRIIQTGLDRIKKDLAKQGII